MKKLLALLLAVIMIFALVACVQTEGDGDGEGDGALTEEQKYGGHLNISSININGRLDPSNVGGVYHWPNLIWESPLSRNEDGSIAPGVCNFELSEDQLTLKLWVREGITFHDGNPVTIDDVVASMLRRGHKSPTQFVVDYLAEEPTVKDGVATFKFKKYSEKTMYYIASVKTLHAVLPKWFCEKYPGTTADGVVNNLDIVDAIGTGPYKADSERDGEWLKLVRYEGYVKGDASLTGGAAPKNAYFDSITFWNQSDATASAIQLLAHDLDVMSATLDEYKPQFALNNLAQTQQMGTKTQFLLFNNMNQENQVHADANLRKAICAALDFEEINTEMWASNYDLTGTPAQDSAYYVDTFNKADYMGKANVELAKEYLKKSNYKGEKIYFVSTNANMAALIESYLKPAGINLDIQIKESESELEKGTNNWNFTFWPFTAAGSPTTVSANAYDRAWVSEEKTRLYNILATTIPGSAEYMQAWKDMAQVWVDECVTVYVGQQYATWTHHEDLVVNYKNADIYIWNWYWKNPAEHQLKG